MSTSTTTTITGSSDDLLEFDGHLYEEFGAGDEGTLFFSDGTRVAVAYGKGGIWRFTLQTAGPSFAGIVPCPDETGEDEYTDTLTMNQIDWAKYVSADRSTQRVYAKGVPNPAKELEQIIERHDAGDAAELVLQHIEKNYLPR